MSQDPFGDMTESTSDRLSREAGLVRRGRAIACRRAVTLVGVGLAVAGGTAIGMWVDHFPMAGAPMRMVGALAGSTFGAMAGLVFAARLILGQESGLDARRPESDDDRAIVFCALSGVVFGGVLGSGLFAANEPGPGFGSPSWFGLGFGTVAAIVAGVYLIRSGGRRSGKSVDWSFRTSRPDGSE